MNAKYLVYDQNYRKLFAFVIGHGPVSRYLAIGDRYFNLARDQAVVIGLYHRLSLYKLNREGKCAGGGDRGYKKLAAVQNRDIRNRINYIYTHKNLQKLSALVRFYFSFTRGQEYNPRKALKSVRSKLCSCSCSSDYRSSLPA